MKYVIVIVLNNIIKMIIYWKSFPFNSKDFINDISI